MGTLTGAPFYWRQIGLDVDGAYEAWRGAPDGQAQDEALARLFMAVKEYAGRLISKLKGKHPPELADDVAVDVIAGIAKFRGEAKFSTWVGAIAKKKWIDCIKKTIRERELFVEIRYYERSDSWRSAVEERPLEVHEPFDLAEYNRKTRDTLHVAELQEHLEGDDLRIFQAVFDEGKTNREAAEMLGKTEAAVESRVRRLRNKLGAQERKIA